MQLSLINAFRTRLIQESKEARIKLQKSGFDYIDIVKGDDDFLLNFSLPLLGKGVYITTENEDERKRWHKNKSAQTADIRGRRRKLQRATSLL